MRGKIKFYNSKRAFGFLVPDEGGEDVYFPATSLPRDREYDPVEGDAVEYETRRVDRGQLAHRIRFIEAV